MFANSVRGLLDRKISEHLQSSNESMKTKTKQIQNTTKRQKERNNNTATCQKKIEEGYSIYFGIVPAASHLIPSPDHNHGPKRMTSTTPYTQSLRFLYRHSRRRLGSPWVGPINVALKRLKLATVTRGATSTLPAFSASLFLCRCSDAFPSSFTHATVNLHRPSRTVVLSCLSCRLKMWATATR